MFLRRLALVVLVLSTATGAARATEDWTADDLRRAMRDWLEANGRGNVPDEAIGPIDDRVRLAPCAERPEIAVRSARGNSFVMRCRGPVAWDFVLRVDGDAGRSVPVAVTSRTSRPDGAADERRVVVAKANLPAGAILSEDVLEERFADAVPGATVLKTVREAAGLRLISAVAPGAVLTTRNVARAPHVMKGEPVTIVAGGPAFEVVMPGRAEADGYEGALISVRNVRSGAVVTGRLGPGGVVAVR